MELIKTSSFIRDFLAIGQSGIPLIICSASDRVLKRIEEAEYKTISVNTELSKALLSFPPDERPKRVEEVFKSLLKNQSRLFIKDFEMLFDPRYEIDVVKLFCDKARITNIALNWPGKFINGKLTYAETGDPDYHEYDCNAYQIRIVQ